MWSWFMKKTDTKFVTLLSLYKQTNDLQHAFTSTPSYTLCIVPIISWKNTSKNIYQKWIIKWEIIFNCIYVGHKIAKVPLSAPVLHGASCFFLLPVCAFLLHSWRSFPREHCYKRSAGPGRVLRLSWYMGCPIEALFTIGVREQVCEILGL